jgi:SPP1 family predicted phage head-tail adaptor
MKGIGSQLNHIFSAYRPERISDGQGGWNETLGEPWEVRGRMRPASGAERTVAAQEQRQISHVLYTEADSGIQRGDVITGAGIEVTVQGVREPSLAGHHLEIDCLEIQRAPAEEGS